MAAILELLRGLADLPAGTETTIECNPSSSIDEQRLQEYQAMGINRISIGMQVHAIEMIRHPLSPM